MPDDDDGEVLLRVPGSLQPRPLRRSGQPVALHIPPSAHGDVLCKYFCTHTNIFLLYPTESGHVAQPGGAGHLGDEADGHTRLLVEDQGGGSHFGGEVAAALTTVFLTRAVNGTSINFTVL